MMAKLSKRQGAAVDLNFSMVTRPVERLVATAQNGLEVLRLGGLETGSVPSPSQIVESVPMYKLRRYFPPKGRPVGPPVLMVHPMMMSADMWDVTRDEGAVGILHANGLDPWVIDFGSPDKIEGGMRRNLADHIVGAQCSGRHHQGRHRQRCAPGRVFAGRDVLLPGRGVSAFQRHRQHRDVRCPGGHPGRTADGYPGQSGCRRGQFHGGPRLQLDGYPKLVGARRFPDAGPTENRQGASRFRASTARPRSAATARTAAPLPRVRRMDRVVGPGGLRAAQAIHRPQPDDDRRLRRQRADGHAHRHHLPGTGVHRRSRRHRPAGVGARHPAGRAQRRGLRTPHPDRTFRSRRRIQGRRAGLADGGRMGAMAQQRGRQAGQRRRDGRSTGRIHRKRCGVQLPARPWCRGSFRSRDCAGPRRGRRRRRREQIDAHTGRGNRPDAAAVGPAGTAQRPHPNLAGPHHRRTGTQRTAGRVSPVRRPRAHVRGRQPPHR